MSCDSWYGQPEVFPLHPTVGRILPNLIPVALVDTGRAVRASPTETRLSPNVAVEVVLKAMWVCPKIGYPYTKTIGESSFTLFQFAILWVYRVTDSDKIFRIGLRAADMEVWFAAISKGGERFGETKLYQIVYIYLGAKGGERNATQLRKGNFQEPVA